MIFATKCVFRDYNIVMIELFLVHAVKRTDRVRKRGNGMDLESG